MWCTNPDNVHCLGTTFPNVNFVFASICAARPVHIQSPQYRSCSTVKQRRAMGSNQKQCCGSEFTKWHDIYLYTRGVRGRIKAKQRWFKVIRELCHEWFHHVHDGHWTWEFDVYTVSQSHSVMTSAENPAPENSPQSIGELRNGHVANLQELYHTRLVRKMVWYEILIHVLIVFCSLELRCVSLIDDAQKCSINYQHLVDLQKHFLQLI